MNPYRILGLKKGATDEEVRAAYRRLALKHHPDRGGDPKRFKAIQDAYAVLSDPVRRARYDATGDCSAQRDDRIEVVLDCVFQHLMTVINGHVQSGADVTAGDMVQTLGGALRNSRSALSAQSAGVRKMAAVLESMAGRFETDGDNWIDQMLARRLADVRREVAAADDRLKLLHDAEALVATYRYRFVQRLMTMSGGGNATGANNGVQWIVRPM